MPGGGAINYDIEYQTDDPHEVVLWLRTRAAEMWADWTGRQRIAQVLPVPARDLAAVLASANEYGLDYREMPRDK